MDVHIGVNLLKSGIKIYEKPFLHMPKIALDDLYANLIDTVTASTLLIVIYCIVYLIIRYTTDDRRQRNRYLKRILYISTLLFILFMARIWVDGFTQLFAVLGLVSAALVIVNKENVLSLFGWLIITWRELFAEDDLIQIQDHKGYVKTIGVFYITLLEVSESSPNHITGRTIRIPNGLITNHSITNYSQISNLAEQCLSFVITQDSPFDEARYLVSEAVKRVINDFYANRQDGFVSGLVRGDKDLASRIPMDISVTIEPRSEKPYGIEIFIRYYCLINDASLLKQKIWTNILHEIESHKSIKLAYFA